MQHYVGLYGLDEEFARAALARAYVSNDAGLTRRVSLDVTLDIVARVRELDFAALYRACEVPLLVVNAVKPEAPQPGAPAWMAEHVAGFRGGVSAELARLSEELPRLSFLEMEASHALIYEEPELVSKQVIAFLAGVQ